MNASGSQLNGILNQTNSFYVEPIRNSSGPQTLYYNTSTKEITYNNNSGPTGAILFNDGNGGVTGSSNFIYNPNSGATGEVYIAGKLTVNGGIDPLYLQLTPQATNPLPGVTGTLWYNSATNKLNVDNATMGAYGPTGTFQLSDGYGGLTGFTGLYYTSNYSTTSNNVIYTSNSAVVIAGDFLPSVSNTYSLGTTGTTWKSLAVGPDTITIVGATGSSELGIDNAGIAYFNTGLSVGFVNVGPSILTTGAVGGWKVGPTGTAGSEDYDLIVQQNKTTPPYGQTGPIYSLIKSPPIGHTLRVDSVNGIDSTANASPYSFPFLTIGNALLKAQSGECVYIYPGNYNETLILPPNVSVRGINLQSVIIQQLNVSTNTTVVTMGTNSRLEDVTVTVTSSNNVNLNAIYFPDATTITSKLRTLVVNATSTHNGANNVYGIYANGSSTNTVSSFNALQRSTINVTSAGTGICRGIYNTGSNYFSVRDATIFCTKSSGSGTNFVGVENTNSGGYTSVKTSTISGTTYDIIRTAGTLLLNSTDLQNSNCSATSFNVSSQPSSISFGTYSTNNYDDGQQFLMPGTVIHSNLTSNVFPIYFSQPLIVFAGSCSCYPALTIGKSAVFKFVKNYDSLSTPPFLTMTLNSTTSRTSNTSVSATIGTNDFFSVYITTEGTVPKDTYFYCNASTY
jgi:hypothetical protein